MKDGTVLEMELEESVYYAKWSNNGDYIAAWSGIYKQFIEVYCFEINIGLSNKVQILNVNTKK